LTNTDIDAENESTIARPRSKKGRETRTRLVEAAKVVFERSGFLNARISDVVAEAGISHGAFYHYFDSKEQIFREVAFEQEVSMTTVAERFGRNSQLPGVTRNAYERIRAANAAYLEAYRSEAKIMKVIEEVSRYDAEVYAVRERRQREFGQLLSANLAQLQQQGLADPRLDPDLVAATLGGMIAKFAEMMLVQGYADFGLMHSIDQLTLLWANAIGLADSERP
jgi:AcrR family transcriptional regulator